MTTKQFDLKITELCNNHCIHCAMGDSNNWFIETEKALQLIEQNVDKETDVVITGGEPLLHKDFPVILFKALYKGRFVIIQTNGRMIKKWAKNEDFKFLLKIYNSRIEWAVAIHSCTPHIHNKIVGNSKAYSQTKDGLKILHHFNQRITLKIVLSKLNYKTFKNLYRPIMFYDIYRISFAYPHGVGLAKDNYKDIHVNMDSLVEELRPIWNDMILHGVDLLIESIPMCYLKEFARYSSDVILSNQVAVSDGKENFDWTKIRKLEKYKPKECLNCICQKICEGFWVEYYNEYNAVFPITVEKALHYTLEPNDKYIKEKLSVFPWQN